MSASEQIQQVIHRISEKNPYYLVWGFVVLTLAIDYFGILQFQLATLRSLNPKITEVSGQITEAENNMKRTEQFRQEMTHLDGQLAGLNDKVRPREEIPLILENISRLGNKHGVRIVEIFPNNALMESILKNDEGEYLNIPIQIEADSGYHDFARFLNELENQDGFMSVPEFSIMSRGGDSRVHTVNLTIDAIVFAKKDKT